MGTRAVWMVAALIAAGCGSADEGGAARGSSGSGAGGGFAGATGSFAGTGGSTSSPGAGQLTRCSDDDECTGGLTCYTFGRYCSTPCATDTDCASMGAGYTCYVAPAFGMMDSGGTSGAGTTGGATGNCRVSCQGPTDTSCPPGLMCIDVGGGFGGMMEPTYRCAYPRMTGGGDSGSSGGGSMSSGGSGGSTSSGGSGGM
jgi:hypothetical protein